MIAQEVATYEGLYKLTQLLDQFLSGLKNAGLFDAIQQFPEEFYPMFVYKTLKIEDVLAAISEPTVTSEDDAAVLGYLRRFLMDCDENGNVL